MRGVMKYDNRNETGQRDEKQGNKDKQASGKLRAMHFPGVDVAFYIHSPALIQNVIYIKK